jgi:HlyD family secretion protein
MKHSKWIYGLATCVLLGGVLAWLFKPAPVSVETARIATGTFTLTIEEDGITRVRDRYVVTTPVAGLLMRPTLRAGDPVTRGETVAVILPNAAQMLDARTRSELAAQVESTAARASPAR